METEAELTIDDRKIRSEVVELDSQQALHLLSASNTHNRNIRNDLVNSYALDMTNGNWRYVGDPIRFGTDSSGRTVLLDGQHRLLALAKTDRKILFRVEHGYTLDDQKVMDTGAMRYLSDQLRITDHPNATMLAAVARKMYVWLKYGHPSIRSGRISYSELMKLIDDPELGPALSEAASFAVGHTRSKLISPSIIGVFHVVFSQIDPDHAEWFLRRVEDGAELPADHPVMVLRRRMIKDREGSGRPSDLYQAACLVIAWNGYRQGKKMSIIKLPSGGVGTHNFPKPI